MSVILGPTAAADAVCHEEQLRIWAHDHIVGALSMAGYLRDDLSYDDGLDLEQMLMREIKSIVKSAMDHPEAFTVRRTTPAPIPQQQPSGSETPNNCSQNTTEEKT